MKYTFCRDRRFIKYINFIENHQNDDNLFRMPRKLMHELIDSIQIYVTCGMPTVYPEWIACTQNKLAYENINEFVSHDFKPMQCTNHTTYKVCGILSKFYVYKLRKLQSMIKNIERFNHLPRTYKNKMKAIQNANEDLNFYKTKIIQLSVKEASERFKVMKETRKSDPDHVYAYLVSLLRSEWNEIAIENTFAKIKIKITHLSH